MTNPTDQLAAYLAEVRKKWEVFDDSYAIPRLVAALEAVLALHAPAADEMAGPSPFRYCSFCAGHPKWPCQEIEAVSAALLGEGSQP